MLNSANRVVRALGTLLVAIALAFIILSIVLADTDGTFAALPQGFLDARPVILNAEALVASIATVFLLGPRSPPAIGRNDQLVDSLQPVRRDSLRHQQLNPVAVKRLDQMEI